MSISPMLLGIDLVRVSLDALTLEELDDHAVRVLDTIGALNGYLNSGHRKSHHALLNAMRVNRKLCLHMARVRDLIQSRKLALTALEAAAATSPPGLPNVPSKGRRLGVIRSLNSADNAASGHIQNLCNGPEGRETKSGCGGEAKEAGTYPQPGEAGMQAKRQG